MGRAARAIRAVAQATGLVAAFAVAAVGAVAAHANLPVARRLVAAGATRALAGVFEGRVVIERIDQIGWRGVSGVDLAVDDPRGRRVVAAHHVTVQLDRALASGAWALALDAGHATLHLARARIEDADVVLDPDAAGVPSLALAFVPRQRSAGAATATAATPTVAVEIPELRIARAHVTGRTPGLDTPLDAEVRHLRAEVHVAHDAHTRVRVDGASLGAPSLLPPSGVRGTVDVEVDVPPTGGPPATTWVRFAGSAGDLLGTASASVRGGDLDAHLDLPALAPEAAAALVAGLALTSPAAVRVDAEGPFGALRAKARASWLGGAVSLAGTVAAGAEHRAELDLTLEHVDAASLVQGAPPTDVVGAGHLALAWPPDAPLAGTLHLTLAPSTIAGVTVEAATLDARSVGRAVEGRATLGEPGISVAVTRFGANFGDASPTLDLEGTADVPSLAASPRLRSLGAGAVHGSVRGTLDRAGLDAHLGLTVEGFRSGSLHVRRAAALGRVRGAFASPSLAVGADLRDLSLGSVAVGDLHAAATGPIARPQVRLTRAQDGHWPALSASATIVPASGGIEAREVELRATRESKPPAPDQSTTLALRAPRLTVRGDSISLAAVTSEGLARTASASFVAAGRTLDVRAQADDLDVARLARLFAFEPHGLTRALGLGATVVAKALGLAPIEGSAARTLEQDDKVVSDAAWKLALAGSRVSFDFAASRSAARERIAAHVSLAPAVGKGLTARASIDVEDGQLRADADVALADAQGTLFAAHATAPALTLSGPATQVASLLGAFGTAESEASLDMARLPAALLDFAGVRLAGTLGAHVGVTRAGPEAPFEAMASLATGGLALDRVAADDWRLDGLDAGAFARLDAAGRLHAQAWAGDAADPLAKLALDLDRSAAGSAFDVATLAALPLTAHLEVPRRAWAKLPKPLRLAGARGDVKLTVDLAGTARAPSVTLDAAAYRLGSGDPSFSGPLDVEAHAAYAASETLADATLRWADGGTLNASARVQAPLADAVWRPDGATWGERLDAADATLTATLGHFHATHLMPFVGNLVRDVDGTLDGRFELHQEPRPGGAARWIEGQASLTDGVVQIPALGQQFHQASATLVARREPGGATPHARSTLSLGELSASSDGGSLRATGEAHLDDLAFVDAKGEVKVDKQAPVPLTLEGVSFGNAWGTLDVAARRDAAAPRRIDVDLAVRELETEVPTSSTRDVQPLDADARIRVGRTDASGAFVAISDASDRAVAPAALAWRIGLDLGDGRTRLRRGTMVDVALSGTPVVVLDGKAQVTGVVRLVSGRIDIFGKRFEIDSGLIRFEDGVPVSSADASVTAHWDAPDATRIYADWVGPQSTGKLTLRAEPQRTEQEILGLLVFGATESDFAGASATPGGSGATSAAGLGGSVATLGLNEALAGVSRDLEISTRVDTSVAQNPRPEVAVAVSRNVSATLGYATGVPVPGQNPDRVLLDIDWRFLTRRDARGNPSVWSLSTIVGDQGSTVLDLVWQHRY